MAGIYDWILNALKSSESNATNQLMPPIPGQNLSGLPVPFQEMPSESAAFNPFTKLMGMFSSNKANPTIPQDAGTNPPNDPLRTAIIQQYVTGMPAVKQLMMGGGNNPMGGADNQNAQAQMPVRFGRPQEQMPMPSMMPGQNNAMNMRRQMMQQYMSRNQNPYDQMPDMGEMM